MPNCAQAFNSVSIPFAWYDVEAEEGTYGWKAYDDLQAWARGVPTVAFVDTGARLDGEPLYRVVEHVAEAAGEVERLFTDEAHWARASARCRKYFDSTHSTPKVLERFGRLLGELIRDRRTTPVHPDHGGRVGTTQ